MNPLDSLLSNSQRIIRNGKRSLFTSNPLLRAVPTKPKAPVTFGIPARPAARPALPQTAATTRQNVAPVPLAAPQVPTPPVNPREIIERGKSAVLRQDTRPLDPSSNQNLPIRKVPVIGPILAGKGKNTVYEKDTLPGFLEKNGVLGALFEGVKAYSDPDREVIARRVMAKADTLIAAGTPQKQAYEKAIADLKATTPAKTFANTNARAIDELSNTGITLADKERRALLPGNIGTKFLAALDVPGVAATTKPIKMATKGFLKKAKYTPEMTKAVNDFADLTNNTRKFSAEEATQIKATAQELADALKQTGHVTADVPVKGDKGLATLLIKHRDESAAVLSATRPSTKIAYHGTQSKVIDGIPRKTKGSIGNAFYLTGDKVRASNFGKDLKVTNESGALFRRPNYHKTSNVISFDVSKLKIKEFNNDAEFYAYVGDPDIEKWFRLAGFDGTYIKSSDTYAIYNTDKLVQPNSKLAAYKSGKGNLQGGYIANPLTPKPKKLNPIDQLIADNRVRVVSRDGRDVYQVKKSGEWTSVRDEDSAIKQASPKSPLAVVAKPKTQLPPALDEKVMSVQFAKDALNENPAKQLARFVSKRGDSKGTLAEVTGKQGSKTGIGTDVRMADLGYENSEEARNAYELYKDRKAQVLAQEKIVKDEVKAWRETERLRVKTQQPAQAVDQIRELRKVAPEQVRSLEEVSQQLEEVLDLPPNKRPQTLDVIVAQTPVSKKVALWDYIRTPDRVMNKIGFAKESKYLRSQYEKYVIELPKNIDAISAWVKRVPKESNERIFDYLDGQAVKLNPTEQAVAEEIRSYLLTWADRLGLPADNRVTNYITRLFEDSLIQKEFDEDLAKIITDRIPGQVYDPFLEKRLGAKGYKRDTWAALDAYTKRATRKVHLDPALEMIRVRTGDLLEYTRLEESQFKYIQRYVNRVQMRPTEIDNMIDNGVKQLVGYRLGQRPVARVSQFLRRMTYRGMLGANLGSALRNLSQGVNTYATLGEKYTAIGYAKLFNTNARKELAEQGVLAQNFIEDRTLSSTKQALQKADKALWFFFDQAEKINRGAAYFGAKAKGIGKGMSEADAIDYAKSIVRKTQFSYDSVDTPVAMAGDLVKTLTQFQTFTVKQSEFLIEMAKDKDFLGLLRYGIAGYVFVNTVGQAMGMEEKELLPHLRFDVPPSLKLPAELTKAALNVPDKYGNVPDTEKKVENIGKATLGLIPGGMQAKKTYEGSRLVEEGASFDKGGRVQFEQTPGTGGKLQSLLFGKYASPQAKDYFKKDTNTGNKSLDKAIEADREAKTTGSKEASVIYAELKSLPKDEANAKLKEIFDTNRPLYRKIKDKQTQDSYKWSKEDEGIASLGVENGARANYLTKQIKDMSKEEANAYLKDLFDRKVISKTVVDQIRENRTATITQ